MKKISPEQIERNLISIAKLRRELWNIFNETDLPFSGSIDRIGIKDGIVYVIVKKGRFFEKTLLECYSYDSKHNCWTTQMNLND